MACGLGCVVGKDQFGNKYFEELDWEKEIPGRHRWVDYSQVCTNFSGQSVGKAWAEEIGNTKTTGWGPNGRNILRDEGDRISRASMGMRCLRTSRPGLEQERGDRGVDDGWYNA